MKRLAPLIGGVLLLACSVLFWPREPQPTPAPRLPPAPADPRPMPADATDAVPHSPLETQAAPDSSSRTPAVPSNSAAPSAKPAEGILVRGSVRDDKGEPVPDVSMTWVDDAGIEVATVVKDGAYAMPGLRPGHFVVELSNAGWQTEQFDVALTAEPAVQQRDFTAHADAKILIRLQSPSGEPARAFEEHPTIFPGAALSAYASRRAPAGTLDPDTAGGPGLLECGRFLSRWSLQRTSRELEPDTLGELELFEPAPLFVSLVSGGAVLQTREIAEVPPEIVFRIDADEFGAQLASVRVRLLEGDGRTPAQNGSLTLISSRGGQRAEREQEQLVLRDLVAGRYTLTLSAPGCGSRMLDVALGPGEARDLGDLALTAAPTLRVTFEYAGGEHPTPRFSFKPERGADPLGTLGDYDSLEFSGAENPYTLDSFEPGAYLLRVTAFGGPRDRAERHLGARPVRVVLGEGENSTRVRIEPTTVVCLQPPRNARRASSWLVATSDGLPCQRVRTSGRAPERIELVPGEYTIALVDLETKSIGRPQSFVVGNEFMTLELRP